MGVDRDVDAKDSGSGEFFGLGGGDGCGGKIFLFGKRRHRVNRCGRLSGRFDEGEGISERRQRRDGGGGHSRGDRGDGGSGNKVGVI